MKKGIKNESREKDIVAEETEETEVAEAVEAEDEEIEVVEEDGVEEMSMIKMNQKLKNIHHLLLVAA